MRYVLASMSPRRRELFAGLDLDFRTCSVDCEETYPDGLQGEDIPLYLSKKKASAYCGLLEDDEVLITADTIVWINGQVLGKPTDIVDAKRMLMMLSGNVHQVFTGVCLTSKERQYAFSTCTDVEFKELSSDEIDYYIEKYRPLDKAGAYGIQEWIGYIGVTGIRGSFYNVMGLPVQALREQLKQFV